MFTKKVSISLENLDKQRQSELGFVGGLGGGESGCLRTVGVDLAVREEEEARQFLRTCLYIC